MNIPKQVIDVIVPMLAGYYTESELRKLFAEVGMAGEPPIPITKRDLGLRWRLCEAWLNRFNSESADPITSLGKSLADYMDAETPRLNYRDDHAIELWELNRERIRGLLAQHGLSYRSGGSIATCTPRQFVTGGLFFDSGYGNDGRFRVPWSMVFVGKDLEVLGERDERETWYFQDVNSYFSLGPFPSLSSFSEKDPVRVIALHEYDLHSVMDCEGLSVAMSEFVRHREQAGMPVPRMSGFVEGDVFFRVSYADEAKLFPDLEAIEFAGKGSEASSGGETWRFEVEEDQPPGEDDQIQTQIVSLDREALAEVLDYDGLAAEVLRCAERRNRWGSEPKP